MKSKTIVLRKNPPEVSDEYWNKGLRHIGMLPDLLKDLKHLKIPGADTLENSAEGFLETWERGWDPNRTKIGS